MFVSINWIKDFVDLEGQDLEQLIHRFTLSTAEVEDIIYKGSDMKDVVVAEIISCENHPDSDHLHVLKVDAGDQIYDVVCGAPNARAGIKTAFVKEGGMVGGEKIKAAKLRGIESHGMCCSERELGISDEHAGIMELDLALANGTDIKEVFPIEDVIFEVDNKSLTNRPDLWGHYGMAREFAALTGQHIKPLPTMENDYTGDYMVPVEIKSDLVYRYTSMRIENITKTVSPMAMRIRLFYCGMRGINLLADLTNYIMLELGQPTHAFDGRSIEKIVVATPDAEYDFKTLDGNDRHITTDTIMIQNNDTPVGIAGIMGGFDSEIVGNSNSVVLECANFDGVSIRKSASRMALRTDAAARYEKTLDPEMTLTAAKRFLYLLKEIDPECVCASGITDVYNKRYPEITIEFDKAYVDRYTGIDISSDRIETTLSQLGFEISRSGDTFTVKVPAWRATKDVTMKADIIEEITRIYGYDNFAIKTTKSPLLPAKTTPRRLEEREVKDLLVKSYAMNEVHSRIWSDPDNLKELGLKVQENVRILGASGDNGYMRRSMLETLLPFVNNNKNYAPAFSIFEIGRAIHGTNAEGMADEHRMLGIAMYDKVGTEKALYLRAVEIINTIASELKHKKASYAKVEPMQAWQHPRNTSVICIGDTQIGDICTLHPSVLSNIGKNASVVCVEIDMDLLLSVEPADLKFDEPSKFPSMDYDLSLVIPAGVRFDDMAKCWETKKKKELKNVSVIDIYDKGQVKSVTLRFTFELPDRTLTSEEVQKDIDKIMDELVKVGVKLKTL